MPRPVKRELSDEAKALIRELSGKPDVGPIEVQVRVYVDTLETLDSLKLSYAEMAYHLARVLDRGAGNSTAAVNKELRETLSRLAEKNDDPDDLLKGISQPL